MDSASIPSPAPSRVELRRALLARREHFGASEDAVAAQTLLARHLADVLGTLAPQCLGLYWPTRSEFNAAGMLAAELRRLGCAIALPFARRSPREMHYRQWDGLAPGVRDECGIPSSDGPSVVPDVVLAPCVGFTADGFRLGYGGGYFDRWLSACPHVTAVGVAWALAEIEAGSFVPEAHDRPLTLIVTERGVVV